MRKIGDVFVESTILLYVSGLAWHRNHKFGVLFIWSAGFLLNLYQFFYERKDVNDSKTSHETLKRKIDNRTRPI